MSHSEYLAIEVDQPQSLAIVRWLRPLQSKEYRYGVLKVGQALLDNHIQKLLVDSRRLGSPTLKDQAWVAEKMRDIFGRCGLRRLARLQSHDIFHQMAAEAVYKKVLQAPAPYRMREFSSEEDALEWLLGPNEDTSV